MTVPHRPTPLGRFLLGALVSAYASLGLAAAGGLTPRVLSWLFLAVTLVFLGYAIRSAAQVVRQAEPVRRYFALSVVAVGTLVISGALIGTLVLQLSR